MHYDANDYIRTDPQCFAENVANCVVMVPGETLSV